MESYWKTKLTEYICEHLPNHLADYGGRVLKKDARDLIHERFKKELGWDPSFNKLDGAKRPHSANAWGFALKRLKGEGITKECARSRYYELK